LLVAVSHSRAVLSRLPVSTSPRPIQGDPERILLWTQVITGSELDEYGQVRWLDANTWQQRRLQLEKLGGPPVP